jgi:hypothetical protein
MPLQDAIAVYTAADNMEAHFVREALFGAGIEAYLTEDLSPVGGWMFGLVPGIHKPQVWIERTDAQRARPILEDFEQRAAELRARAADEQPTTPIEVVCEKCGKSTEFPASQRGSVQECAHCGAFVDVASDEEVDDWAEFEEEEEPEEGT